MRDRTSRSREEDILFQGHIVLLLAIITGDIACVSLPSADRFRAPRRDREHRVPLRSSARGKKARAPLKRSIMSHEEERRTKKKERKGGAHGDGEARALRGGGRKDGRQLRPPSRERDFLSSGLVSFRLVSSRCFHVVSPERSRVVDRLGGSPPLTHIHGAFVLQMPTTGGNAHRRRGNDENGDGAAGREGRREVKKECRRQRRDATSPLVTCSAAGRRSKDVRVDPHRVIKCVKEYAPRRPGDGCTARGGPHSGGRKTIERGKSGAAGIYNPERRQLTRRSLITCTFWCAFGLITPNRRRPRTILRGARSTETENRPSGEDKIDKVDETRPEWESRS